MPGANTSSCTTTAVSDSSGNEYYATIKDGCGTSFTTTPALLGVACLGVPPIITLQPLGAAIPVGGTYTFRTDTSSDQNGSNFYVVVDNGQTSPVTSTTAGLWVGQLP